MRVKGRGYFAGILAFELQIIVYLDHVCINKSLFKVRMDNTSSGRSCECITSSQVYRRQPSPDQTAKANMYAMKHCSDRVGGINTACIGSHLKAMRAAHIENTSRKIKTRTANLRCQSGTAKTALLEDPPYNMTADEAKSLTLESMCAKCACVCVCGERERGETDRQTDRQTDRRQEGWESKKTYQHGWMKRM